MFVIHNFIRFEEKAFCGKNLNVIWEMQLRLYGGSQLHMWEIQMLIELQRKNNKKLTHQ